MARNGMKRSEIPEDIHTLEEQLKNLREIAADATAKDFKQRFENEAKYASLRAQRENEAARNKREILKEEEAYILKTIFRTEKAQEASNKKIWELKNRNADLLIQLEEANIDRAEKAKLASENQILEAQIKNSEILAEIEAANLDRKVKAELAAENEINELRLANAKALADIEKEKNKLNDAGFITELRNSNKLKKQQDLILKQQQARAKRNITGKRKGDKIRAYFSDAEAAIDPSTLDEGSQKLYSLKAGAQDFFSNIQTGWEDGKNSETRKIWGDQSNFKSVLSGIEGAARAAISSLANIAQQLDGAMESLARNKSAVDTRLNGLDSKYQKSGSYWGQILQDFSALMVSPLLKIDDLYKNAITVVNRGIARDVEQFAMLETIKDKIASTFNTFDGTMLRLIRIQDYNTSAARLGMEASLNAFLNEMYQSTEYLSEIAASVRSSLEEAQALMSGQEGVAFEYQAQKWLGSLYSVGMSSSGVNSIASALGKLASGQIEGIASGGASNLLVMATNNSNMSIADVLANGLDSSETNVLLNNVVAYMNELVDMSGGNLVVQQQLAKVFGLTASDLRAVKNIVSDEYYTGATMAKIYGTNGQGDYLDTYSAMLGTLGSMAGSMYKRISIGEMLNNAMSNVTTSIAAGMASNPVSYLGMKTANILDALAGGVALPAIMAVGTGVDTKLTVSDIARMASVVVGLTQSLGAVMGNISSGNGAGITGGSLLKMVGINTSNVSRDTRTSSSGTGSVVNASVQDMTDSATATNDETVNSKKASVKEKETEVTNTTINENIVKIVTLLEDVTNGNKSFTVQTKETALGMIASALTGGFAS